MSFGKLILGFIITCPFFQTWKQVRLGNETVTFFLDEHLLFLKNVVLLNKFFQQEMSWMTRTMILHGKIMMLLVIPLILKYPVNTYQNIF